jgi:hypothetical protein
MRSIALSALAVIIVAAMLLLHRRDVEANLLRAGPGSVPLNATLMRFAGDADGHSSRFIARVAMVEPVTAIRSRVFPI